MTEEPWVWSKAGGSLVSGRRYGKDIITLFRYAIILGLAYLMVMGVFWVKNSFSDKPEQPQIVNTEGGNVDQSERTSQVNLLPFFWKN